MIAVTMGSVIFTEVPRESPYYYRREFVKYTQVSATGFRAALRIGATTIA
jgi:hypothetical protein